MDKTAYDLGLEAAENGDDETVNPFALNSDEWLDWRDGFESSPT
ncbi:hypothetical protein R70006_04936 [Paraburkholderia domus]|nr:hypothetical protein [Paraburkholderia domus]CAE6793019.1 hypothetical protein R70006_04936 [Paraburkholderia domus]